MKNQIDVAFKEWAVVVQGMEEGRQTLLLTKDGVKEVDGTYVCEQTEFLLFPTRGYDAGDIKPDWKPRLAKLDKMVGDPKHVPFKVFCLVDCIVKVTDWEAAKQFVPFTVLSEAAVERKFKESDWEGFYCLLVRPYTLAMPMDLTRKDSYEPPPRWVHLETSLYTVGSQPVMPDEVWPLMKSKILKLLQP